MLVRLYAKFRSAVGFQTPQPRGQGLMEFALVVPLLLIFVFGIIEAGRMLAIYSSLSSAAKQAARYGSVAGDSGTADPTDPAVQLAFYEDCNGIRAAALRTSLFVGLEDNDIGIGYDRGTSTEPIGRCALGDASPTLSETIKDGYRVIITTTAIYRPLVPLIPLPDLPITFAAARTIFTTIVGPTNTPRPDPDLRITKVGSPLVVSPNGTLTYWITATNPTTGVVVANNIVITDTLPVSVTVTTATLTSIQTNFNWACSFTRFSPAPQSISCSRIAPLVPGQSSGFSFPVQAPLFGGVTLTNTTGVQSAKTDLNATDNYTYTVNQVLPGADLQVYKTASDPEVGAGTPLTYTLSVVNNGGGTSQVKTNGSASTHTYIWLTDTLPVGAQLKMPVVPPAGWTCPNQSNMVLGCRYGLDLPASATTPLLTVVITAPTTAQTLVNTAVVTPSTLTADPLPLNNVVTATAEVVITADLELFMAGPTGPYDIDQLFTYRINVTNHGRSIANGIVTTHTLPAGIAYDTSTGWGATACAGTGTVVCAYTGTLYPGQISPDLTMTVLGTAEGFHTYAVDVRASQPDPEDPDNTDSHGQVTTEITDCQPGRVDSASSTVSGGSPDQVQADNTATSVVQVTVRDKCGAPISGVKIRLAQSGAASTVTTASDTTGSDGRVQFDVRSSTIGQVTLTPHVTTATQVDEALTATASVTFYGCVMVTGQASAGSGQPYVDFRLDNASGRTWMLSGLSLAWPAQGGSRQITSVVMNISPAVTLWSGSSPNNPFNMPGSGAFNGGTEAARTLNNGVAGQTLRFNLSLATTGMSFTLSSAWDDGSGHTCTSAPASVTH